MSLLVFTGASQFSAVSVVAAGGSTAAALGGALLLAARNGVYGWRCRGPRRLARHRGSSPPSWSIDESTAMATAQTDARAQRAAFWITGVSVFVFWNLGTLVGALAGSAIDPRPSASTPPSRPASWRWSPRSCATASACWPGCWAAPSASC